VKRLAVIPIVVGLALGTAAPAQAAQVLDKDVAYNAFPAYAQARERNWDHVVFAIGARPGQGISYRWEIVCGNGWDRWKSGQVRTSSKAWVVDAPLHTRCYLNVTAALADHTGTVWAKISVK
jgi:hypothetical protein